MIETTVRHLGDVRFEVAARGHRAICDQPLSNGGSDAGMTPPEFLLAALGACAGFYAAQYLRARQLSSGGLEVRVAADKATQPARLDGFSIQVTVPGLDEKHIAGVERAVKLCLIHNTFTHPPRIETIIQTWTGTQKPDSPEISSTEEKALSIVL